jgi:Alpha/beta hydrolase of unknown function (DUF900)
MIFFNLRLRPSGDGVADHVAVHDITLDAAHNVVQDAPVSIAALASAVAGKNLLVITHGFNVNQLDGYRNLSNWSSLLDLDDTWSVVGVVWPGDSSLIGPLSYPGEGQHAMSAGNVLAPFIRDNLAGAASISFVSHSLGARFFLQTITVLHRLAPGLPIRQIVLMAGAINHDCLTAEYAVAANSITNIAVLASTRDEVLSAAFPIGNLLEGIIDFRHPWFESALGHLGPKTIPPGKAIPGFQIPALWDYGHGSYLLLAPRCVPALPLPQRLPPQINPESFLPGHDSSWSAAFVSSLFR